MYRRMSRWLISKEITRVLKDVLVAYLKVLSLYPPKGAEKHYALIQFASTIELEV
jgi:hypothetical protein